MSDPTHPQHDELMEWHDGPFDPADMAPDIVDAALEPIRSRVRMGRAKAARS